MRVRILLLALCCVVFAHNNDGLSSVRRSKRGAVGALDIVTNNAHPIHAEVKGENAEPRKLCSEGRKYIPSKIEPGVVFQVIPPKTEMYESKSLRKSLPLISRLDLLRAVSRIITLSTLATSAVFEFYPLFRHAYYTVIEIMYNT